MNEIDNFLSLVSGDQSGPGFSTMNCPLGAVLALGSKLISFAPLGLAALGFFATLFLSGYDSHDADDD